MSEFELHGSCDDAFSAVKEAFHANFTDHDELGAGLCVIADGRTVVDLWGGFADVERTRPWERDTLVNVWSTTKGLVALCAQLLVERGQLDVDVPVATYWPEFAAAGKEELPVRYLLSHRAGLTGAREPLTVEDLYDWDRMTTVLAATEPWWTPGEVSGYHAFTFGYLVGEVIRRVSGRSPGQFFAEEVAGPLGLDAFIGLPASEHGRVAELTMAPQPEGSDYAEMFAQVPPAALAAIANPTIGGRP